jgi:DNA-directed RNA polymerase specialized sigma24 family protein
MVIAKIQAGGVHFRDQAGLEAYLATVGKSRLRDQIRRMKAAKRDRNRTLGDAAEALGQVAESGPTPSRIAELREQVDRVARCASPSELELIRDHADKVNWRELASERRVSPEALRKRIERVRRRIREALADSHSDARDGKG